MKVKQKFQITQIFLIKQVLSVNLLLEDAFFKILFKLTF